MSHNPPAQSRALVIGQPERPIRLAVMMLTLATGRMGGTEVYAENLVSNLRELADDRFDITIVRARQQNTESSRTQKSSDARLGSVPISDHTSHGGRFRELSVSSLTAGITHAQKLRAWLLSLVRRRRVLSQIEAVAGGPIDVALFPFTAVQPRPRRRTKTVVVVHDLQHLDMPRSFSLGQRVYRRFAYETPARRADAVITVSDFTSASVAEHLNVATSKIHRVYPGIDTDLFRPARRNAPTDPVLYYPARGLPHKNHQRLFRAVELVRAAHPRLTLILSGSDEESLHPLPDFVVHVGNITPQEIRDLYREVTAVVFPSLYEGFGFPPLEALASGTPVIASRAGALPEVLADHAILVDQTDVASIADGIERALVERALASDAANLSRFTWSKTATNVLQVCANVVADGTAPTAVTTSLTSAANV